MRLVYKIWLEENDKAFGEGPYELLKGIHRLGSLNKTVKELRISYSKAWNIIKRSEEQLGFLLLERTTGGITGGGSSLTPEAIKLIKNYEKFKVEADKALMSLHKKYLEPMFR